MRGLFKGFWATFWRDVPGWAVYFYAYEGLKKLAFNENQSKSWDCFLRLMCGGIAGQLSWVVSFPFDVVKTHMMCDQSLNSKSLRNHIS
jgi:solute carrier family 25 carnitine/acylcarnitine transporter 20/29